MPSLLPTVATAPRSDFSPSGDHLADAGISDSEVVVGGVGDGGDSDRPRSKRRPPQVRGRSYEGVAADETGEGWGVGNSKRRQRDSGGTAVDGEEGLEMQITGASAAAAVARRQADEEGPEGRRRGRDADGTLFGGADGVLADADGGDAPLVPPSPPPLLPNVTEERRGTVSPAPDPAAAGGANQIHGVAKQRRLGSVDSGGDRWIGFAGSPRGDRTGRGETDVERRLRTARLPRVAAGLENRRVDPEESRHTFGTDSNRSSPTPDPGVYPPLVD